MDRRRWLLADQLGPHFLDDPDQPVLLVEIRELFRQRPVHRQKAHLILSALRHRAAELGDQALLLRADTFREALTRVAEPVEVSHPHSWAALRFAQSVPGLTVLPARGFITSQADFAGWADRARRGPLRMTDFYRHARRRHDVLTAPAGGTGPGRRARADNRAVPEAPPPPPPIVEDDIDAEVRRDLDRWAADGVRFVGRDGPRQHPATHTEAQARLAHFLTHRLPGYGRYADVMSGDDPLFAHSVLSSSFNLGLLDPEPAVRAAEQAWRAGTAPSTAVEPFIRGLLGWREFLWQLYWYFEPPFRGANWLAATESLPQWFAELDADAVEARCLADVLGAVRDRAWTHHTPRLLVLGNYALQRGWRPTEVADWFQRCFVDGTDWVMNATVIGMSQYADLARVDTRPYAVDGTDIDEISDYCAGCRYAPERALGDLACPYTGGFESFLHRNRDRLVADPRLAAELARRDDPEHREAVLAQEEKRGSTPP
ncbi:cryptochrome/photolyase family protein [Micromonospora parathelypteridis]|uniref:Deoxyribodipyrimidine photolyase-related protein n=1 Tax=Micromonospora parathelypteridis TaxID=1839617 RepID=A0A840VWY5_9ACTN|nr:cryptochrome/photolyase family protein [Micromonospora parathelypteridis]MBB5481235.1 deoxyribodipyrimidine photolyase-related protein [Micromonospora parathelypteridis]GGO19464.1 deoxyribodipyrimidine photo-lyase [Micromonospora parathelypteridis]